jgi:calcium-dependent protein kinase
LKLENFLYERGETHSDHLKLIDFGFATRWDGKKPMTKQCGSPCYVAPEVLSRSYTDKADMWSVGVIAFMLLVGEEPILGEGNDQLKNIRRGRIKYDSKFQSLSEGAQSFIKSLLVVNSHSRLSAADALKHPWLEEMNQCESSNIDSDILHSLRSHAQAPALERACLSVAAWSLPLEETIMLREQFSAIDMDGNGTITCDALKQALGVVGENQVEVETLFNSLDTNGDKEIAYSEFLAGALHGRVHLNMEAVRETFSIFDSDRSGEITAANFGSVGLSADAEALVFDADTDANGAVSPQEFFTFLQGKCGMIEERVEFSAWDGSPVDDWIMSSFVRPLVACSGMLSF